MIVACSKPRLRLRDNFFSRPRAFTLLELEVAIVLLTFGVITIASLMTTQQRVLKRLEGDYKPAATLCITRPIDPWVKKLNTPARITADPLTQTPPPTVHIANDVSILTQFNDLNAQSITVTAEVTEAP